MVNLRPLAFYDATSYEYFTGQDLDCMINQTVSTLMDCGFKPPGNDGAVVALFTLSDFNMVVAFFALSRLGIRATLGEILRLKLIACRPIIQKSCLDAPQGTDVLVLHRTRNPEVQKQRVALILHSSGSTGLPKPLYLSHKAIMTHPMRGLGFTSFNSLPWYHLHCLSTALQAMYMRKTVYMWDVSLPLTASSVTSALEAAKPESFQGLDALRQCKLVTYCGAPCPDELGDRLVAEKVHFGGSFGLTEAGLVAESLSRPAGDPFWNFVKFFENLRPFIWMKPIGADLYECVYLAGHPALTASNSDEPPESYHSRDVFTPHSTIPDRWKYVTRFDDRLTLVNGEKVLPLHIEVSIKQISLIQEAVVIGVGKSGPGLLYLNLIWPTVEGAKPRAEQFSQISRDMIARSYPLAQPVLAQIREPVEKLGFPISRPHSAFFAEGVDSLKAIHQRRLILRDFMITDSKTITVQSGQDTEVEDEVSLMPGAIEKYSTFRMHTPNPNIVSNNWSVILTGATGAIGAHTLFKLLNDITVSAVYCLTRREQPKEEILDALAEKGLEAMPFRKKKIVVLKSALDKPDLDVGEDMLAEMQRSVSLIIHTAWPVNFNLPLANFEPHIQGLDNLIQFSLSVHLPAPAVVLFCSSISTALGAPTSDNDKEPLDDLNRALEMGYGRSKLIGEKIVSNARKLGARAFSLRIGQVSGYSKKGLWNDSEAIPLIIRSALTLKAPLEESEGDAITSEYIDDTIFNLSNPRTFTWSALLDALRQSGFDFQTDPFHSWLQMLHDSESRSEEMINPAVKLADHYEATYGEEAPVPKTFVTEKDTQPS
ncbi:hypothetical protein BDV37DRAFT_276712 [Aspergillus pseudonomiae]|uniref:Male sterility protein-domain-containing protein n=1 Tax=Aspergillus pseudonomiae TaxID=1506151 RepID=A0A5N7CVR0_9EURO|nr:uncharacterized protein BDV37DRAFT_276712 [Aspergillus pseudonomiae]KAE8397698.1 hypothetical protein BDV37DRAFT_276712 [Aspergillus pseudonomiae]